MNIKELMPTKPVSPEEAKEFAVKGMQTMACCAAMLWAKTEDGGVKTALGMIVDGCLTAGEALTSERVPEFVDGLTKEERKAVYYERGEISALEVLLALCAGAEQH